MKKQYHGKDCIHSEIRIDVRMYFDGTTEITLLEPDRRKAHLLGSLRKWKIRSWFPRQRFDALTEDERSALNNVQFKFSHTGYGSALSILAGHIGYLYHLFLLEKNRRSKSKQSI